MRKELGKITSVEVGIGGYQDAMFGISFTFSFGGGAGVSDFVGAWDPECIKVSEYTKWSETDRDVELAKMCRFISKLLSEAKVRYVDELKGIPVEVSFEGNTLQSWRILTEVL